MNKPQPSEYFHYYHTYVSKIPEGEDLIDALKRGRKATNEMLRRLPDSAGELRYREDKWSIKEVLAHLSDSERTFCYRAMWFARGAADRLPSFEQVDFVRESFAARRSLADMIEEFDSVRGATIGLFKGIAPEAEGREGIASDKKISVRALAYIIAGHEIHHRDLIKERYLPLLG